MKGFKCMKLLTGLLSMVLIMGFFASAAMGSEVPMTVSYQGELANVNANAVTMTFYLFADENGQQTQWSQEIRNIDVVNGVVSTILGADEQNSITEDVLSNAKYLGIRINNGDIMQPISELTSSIFAMRAAVADKLASGAVAFTLEHVAPGSIPAGALADNSVASININDDAVTSKKTSVSVVDKYSATGGITQSFELNKEDQGLILVSGEVTLNLPQPSNAAGNKFTIKKIDNGLQRESGNPCELETNKVTIKCGSNITNWFTDSKLIENRTNKVILKYKNAHATFVSDGKKWYITDSNPPLDIFNPVPGANGKITTKGQDIKTFPIPLDLTPATDCDARACETCKEDLYYMPVFSRSNSHKLKTLDNVILHGEPCLSSWVNDPTNLTCDPSSAPSPYNPGELGGFRVNVVVRDYAGNMSIYYPPGDNEAPEASDYFIDSRRGSDFIRLEWSKATDNEDMEDDIFYSVYLNKEGNTNCLLGLDADIQPTFPPECENYIVASKEKMTGQYVSDGESVKNKVYAAANEFIMIFSSAMDSEENTYDLEPATTYYFTIVAEDSSGNKRQYNTSDTTTEAE